MNPLAIQNAGSYACFTVCIGQWYSSIIIRDTTNMTYTQFVADHCILQIQERHPPIF